MTGWDPGALVGAAALACVVIPTLVRGYKYASDYVHRWRFPDSKLVRQRFLKDPEIQGNHNLNLRQDFLSQSGELISHSAGSDCWPTFLSIFNVLQMPLPSQSPKPSQLLLEKNYFLTDAQTIFTCLLSIMQSHTEPLRFSEDNGRGGRACWTTSRIRVTFRRQDDLCLAHIQLDGLDLDWYLYKRLIARRTIREYQRIIIDGYPPWYQMKVTNSANVTFDFPTLDNGNINRGGWIVAIGLGNLDPLPYFSAKLGTFSAFGETGGWHHRDGTGSYRKAFMRLQQVIKERFTSEAFPFVEEQNIITTALKEVDCMVENHSASVCKRFLPECPQLTGAYDGTFIAQLNSVEIKRVIDFFNNRKSFDASEVGFCRLRLKPVMAGVLCGLRCLFMYFNDGSFQISAEVEKMIEDNPDIYLEGCQA